MSPFPFIMIFKIMASVFLFSFFSFIICSCKPRSHHDQESVKLKAYRLIDAGHPLDAILYLENALESDPNNREYKFILASAYADRSGIKIQNLVPLVNEVVQMTKTENEDSNLKNEKNKIERIDLIAKLFSNILKKYSLAFHILATIPTVKTNEIIYLKHAIRLLEELLNEEKTQNIALYKAVLETIIFKYNLSSYMNDDDFSFLTKKCQIDINKTFEFIDMFSESLTHIYQDLAIARPLQKDNYEKATEDMKEKTNIIKSFLISIETQDAITLENLKKIALQNQYGNLLLCEQN